MIRYGGLVMLCLLVYGSTGLIVCFIIPSGAVLFAAGIYAAAGKLHESVFIICALLVFSSLAGNVTGYWFGRKAGPSLYKRNDSRFFKKHYLTRTEEFYSKYGKIALTIGFFLPIIRTFAPVIAGVVRMDFRRFFFSSLIGAIVSTLSFVLAGYFIGMQPSMRPWLEYIVGGFIVVVTVPLVLRITRELRKSNKGE